MESQALDPLPSKRYELKDLCKWVRFIKTVIIYLSKDKHYYSAPYQYIGKKIRIVFSNSVVGDLLQNKNGIAIHTRIKSNISIAL